jgi:hypothetical protein
MTAHAIKEISGRSVRMQVTTYAYPWDLVRLGVERTLRQMADDGIDAIDLAATYHPIDALSPRGGVDLFTITRGAVFFPARAERYGRIRPHVHDGEICAAWPETARLAGTLGLQLNAWTITLYQPWIRDAHPDCARVLPSGDRSGAGVCPANEDVREFLVTLCEDVVDQFGVSLVRLENIVPIFDFDWLRPRVLVEIPPLARTLLNLCFCNSCTQKAAAAGLDAARLRKLANEAINAEIAEGKPSAKAAALADDTDLHLFAGQYARSSTELVSAIASRIKGRARVSVNASASYAPLLGVAADEALMAEFIASADQIALHPGNPRNKSIAELAARAAPPREISALIPLVRAAGSGGPVLEAPISRSEAMVEAAAGMGASELSLYNYGLLRERDIPEFVAWVRRTYP